MVDLHTRHLSTTDPIAIGITRITHFDMLEYICGTVQIERFPVARVRERRIIVASGIPSRRIIVGGGEDDGLAGGTDRLQGSTAGLDVLSLWQLDYSSWGNSKGG